MEQVVIKIPTYASGSLNREERRRFDRATVETEYAKNPAKCAQCAGMIPLLPGASLVTVRRNKLCSDACRDLWRRRPQLKLPPAPHGEMQCVCEGCNKPFTYQKEHRDRFVRKFCSRECRTRAATLKRGRQPRSDATLKGELFRQQATWQSARTAVRHHATKAANRAGLVKQCKVCQYSHHVELAHRKSVSSFPDTATLGEINAPVNLVYLCPNHHWEYDNDLIQV